MNTEYVSLLESALDVTLSELREQGSRKRAARSDASRLAYWVEDECSAYSERVQVLSEIIASPVKAALLSQLSRLSEMLLDETKSEEKANEILEWVAMLDVEHFEARLTTLDRAYAAMGWD